MSNDNDPEIVLRAGEWTTTVAPYGASLRGATWRGEPVVTSYHGRENKQGGQGDVLIPFPGRVARGAYTFEGTAYQMPINDKESPGAIHGFLRSRVWEVAGQAEDRVSFQLRFEGAEGYPFALEANVGYTLGQNGLACLFTLTNRGDKAAPVAAGFHPYFTALSDTIDNDTLTVPFASYLEFDERLIPTGRVLSVEGTPYDFRAPRVIGNTRLNTCYLDPTPGAASLDVRLESARRRVTVTMATEPFGSVVLYSGDPMPATHARRALAIEPMTCGSDAFNHPEWGLRRLEPGQSFGGTWGVRAEEKSGGA